MSCTSPTLQEKRKYLTNSGKGLRLLFHSRSQLPIKDLKHHVVTGGPSTRYVHQWQVWNQHANIRKHCTHGNWKFHPTQNSLWFQTVSFQNLWHQLLVPYGDSKLSSSFWMQNDPLSSNLYKASLLPLIFVSPSAVIAWWSTHRIEPDKLFRSSLIIWISMAVLLSWPPTESFDKWSYKLFASTMARACFKTCSLCELANTNASAALRCCGHFLNTKCPLVNSSKVTMLHMRSARPLLKLCVSAAKVEFTTRWSLPLRQVSTLARTASPSLSSASCARTMWPPWLWKPSLAYDASVTTPSFIFLKGWTLTANLDWLFSIFTTSLIWYRSSTLSFVSRDAMSDDGPAALAFLLCSASSKHHRPL